MMCCNACYDTDPRSGMFLPAEPAWMDEFRQLVKAGEIREAMAVIDTPYPAACGPRSDRIAHC
jgi:hypothetical protein